MLNKTDYFCQLLKSYDLSFLDQTSLIYTFRYLTKNENHEVVEIMKIKKFPTLGSKVSALNFPLFLLFHQTLKIRTFTNRPPSQQPYVNESAQTIDKIDFAFLQNNMMIFTLTLGMLYSFIKTFNSHNQTRNPLFIYILWSIPSSESTGWSHRKDHQVNVWFLGRIWLFVLFCSASSIPITTPVTTWTIMISDYYSRSEIDS